MAGSLADLGRAVTAVSLEAVQALQEAVRRGGGPAWRSSAIATWAAWASGRRAG